MASVHLIVFKQRIFTTSRDKLASIEISTLDNENFASYMLKNLKPPSILLGSLPHAGMLEMHHTLTEFKLRSLETV